MSSPRADEIEGFVLGRALPAVLSWAGFEFDNFVQDMLPGPLRNPWIAVLEVDPRKAQIHRGLPAGFVQGKQQPFGLGLVSGLEALVGFGGVVESVVNAFATEEKAVSLFHASFIHEPTLVGLPAVKLLWREVPAIMEQSRHNHFRC